ncbi:PREDICTED: probable pectinesterase 53 [Erythranthe guttata]|uniref:probable pectinesterase 53 n=1 Tax=Erythranthe guttata TaxID=4155 RepID=UPI00064DA768|nr:PREDICTED: probable pectinesterase 53 [Erythranthe guttata]|eukprot:XP_012849441.1 PREDICTED: probable pectinesterase 53 [Erythranthe guttata]
MQGVALRISGDASAFAGCKFLGAQDTLYDHKGRHYYEDCYIEGSVDFIFGDGRSYFKGCELHAIATGAVAAQNRSASSENTGFSLVNCKVTGSDIVYLGRAWAPFSTTVFAYTYMENNVNPEGWFDWNDPSRQSTVTFGEYQCSGPGSNTAGRVKWSKILTDEEAGRFTSLDFIDASEWLDLS